MTTSAQIDIAELRRLEADATPAPWWTDGKYDAEEAGLSVIAAREDCGPLPGNPTRGQVAFVTELLPENAFRAEANAALIVAMRNALPELLKALDATDEPIEALAIYGFPVSDAAETALLNRGAGSREAQRLHKAAKALIAAREALPPHGGNDVG